MSQNSNNYFSKLSDICSDIAQVCLASFVVPYVIGENQWWFGLQGLTVAIFFWYFSLYLIKEDNI